MGHIVNRPISDYLAKSFGIKPDYTTHITNKLYHMRMYNDMTPYRLSLDVNVSPKITI
jgi:hypothetical protein